VGPPHLAVNSDPRWSHKLRIGKFMEFKHNAVRKLTGDTKGLACSSPFSGRNGTKTHVDVAFCKGPFHGWPGQMPRDLTRSEKPISSGRGSAIDSGV
jgi:hypothetical protein